MSSRRSLARRFAPLFLTVAAAVSGFLYYRLHFAAAETPAVASPELARLLADDAPFESVLWLASPHQNLGALDERVGDLELYLGELSRLTGVRLPRLPRFGPFALPPARELVLGWNGGGESFLGVARIEPGIGWIARLAGRVAGTPWLAGGRIDAAGRSFDVRWQGPLWIVTSGTPFAFEPSTLAARERAPSAGEPLALAQLRLRHATGPVPAGRFVLARGSDGLEVRSGELPQVVQAASEWSFPGVALWASTTDRGPVGGPGLVLLWEAAEGAIPRVAVLQRGGGRSFRLPGESILAMMGAAEPASRLGWTVRATQKSARREALLMVPWFERQLPRPGGRGPWLGRAGRLVPAASVRTLDLLVGSLEKLPLLPPGEMQRLVAASRLLAPFQSCGAVAFEVWHDPEGARLRLCTPVGEPGTEAEIEESSPSEDE